MSFIDFYLLILYHFLRGSSAHGKIKRAPLLLPGVSEEQTDRQTVWKPVKWNKDTFVSFVLLKDRKKGQKNEEEDVSNYV